MLPSAAAGQAAEVAVMAWQHKAGHQQVEVDSAPCVVDEPFPCQAEPAAIPPVPELVPANVPEFAVFAAAVSVVVDPLAAAASAAVPELAVATAADSFAHQHWR